MNCLKKGYNHLFPSSLFSLTTSRTKTPHLLALLQLLLDAFNLLAHVRLKRLEEVAHSFRRQFVQAMLGRNVLGLVEGGDRQLGGAPHHKALGHALHELLVVGQVAQENADDHGALARVGRLELGVLVFLDQFLFEHQLIAERFQALLLLLFVVVDSG